jgi:hypothetical protein
VSITLKPTVGNKNPFQSQLINNVPFLTSKNEDFLFSRITKEYHTLIMLSGPELTYNERKNLKTGNF